MDLASRVNYRITRPTQGESLHEVISKLINNYDPIEKELFYALFKFNLSEIDASDMSE